MATLVRTLSPHLVKELDLVFIRHFCTLAIERPVDSLVGSG